MRNEDAFNAYLSKKLNAFSPEIAKLKMAEKYHVGIPDFCLWKGGRSVVVESKLIKSFGKPASKASLLKHPFTGPQQTFLQTMMRAGVPAFGLIGVDDIRDMLLLPANLIPPDGTWTAAGLESVVFSGGHVFDFDDVAGLVDILFEYEVEDGLCRRIGRSPLTPR
jgi:hypothetical protein